MMTIKLWHKLLKHSIALWLICLPSLVFAVEFAAIERNIGKAMETFDVPGVAVAIVKDDKLVYAKGFGVTKRGTDDKVDAKTLFGIASNTKAFTAAAMAMLVEEGRLKWDDKVITHLPNFQMNDPYVTAQMTVADLLSHRSGLGLGAGDLMIWPTTDVSNAEIMANIRHIKPASSFRSQYAYNNIMFVVAGELIAKVSGTTWRDFIQQRILKPLSMNDTRMAYSLIEPSNNNVATPHAPVDGAVIPVGGDFLENFSSAGSMASNVTDISKWLRVQLKKGLIKAQNGDEQRLFSDEQHYQMWSAKTVQEVTEFYAEQFKTNFRAYGLGWGLNDYYGHKMVGHTGGILGMLSKVVLIPESKLGVVILTNQQSGNAFNSIAYDIVDRFIGNEPKDWIGIYQQRRAENQKELAMARKAFNDDRHLDTKPSLPLKDYVYTYHDQWYGDIELTQVSEQLQINFTRTKALVGKLEHYHHDTFVVRWNDASINADAYITFVINTEGKVVSATLKPVLPDVDFSFNFHDLFLQPKSSGDET